MSRITKLLIAGRGEIARRIMRTAREMGIATVAVYADPDARSPHVGDADEAVALRGTTSAETYLDIAKIIDAARRTGANGVHPGYGFLSENAEFAQAVIDAGLVWVGPRPEAIATMGDKLAAKKLMTEARVPTLPAVEITDDIGDGLKTQASEVGYPLLVKAAAGGGGKGMRVVAGKKELADAVSGARREAASAFGNDTVFLERLLESSRHIEVQVFGDKHGNVLHCFERECSIQRRYQKIIEEAPSPAVDAELRLKLGEAAVAATKAIGYDNAGTVEFMLDGEGNFYFLEMNTRLQVEHPVTEEITGLDLVREQIRVAEGDPLSFRQDDLHIEGHAIEARLYAEDPAADFLPATGTLITWEPDPGLPARFDSGVEAGFEVSPYFDPMLAKVIVHAPTRTEAAARLANVLERLRMHGVTSNRDFLVNVLRHDAFLSGDTTTDFIERHNPAREREVSDEEVRAAALAAALTVQQARRAEALVLTTMPSGWRNNPSAMQQVRYQCRGKEVVTEYVRHADGGFGYNVNGHTGELRIIASENGRIQLEIDGVQRTLAVVSADLNYWVHGVDGEVQLIELPRFPEREREEIAGGYLAPMPGRIVAVHVEPGQKVSVGESLIIVEAMKMEHVITCAEDGVIMEVRVVVDEQVEAGQLLLVVDTGKEDS
ncbi:MAG: acetyl/propionyl-CoA carboxylase subunit alpha [Chloroflexi bacterium]|nr:acetyl/propionyl-CoA carboxylase subunit alpha [Chloroflexota bacterium]